MNNPPNIIIILYPFNTQKQINNNKINSFINLFYYYIEKKHFNKYQ